jgi:beta-glucosidase
VDGTQTYAEGFGIGYRGHDRAGVAPLFPFGHGLSYGTVEWGEAIASTTTMAPDDTVTVSVPVTATGDRDATVVVQGYVAPGRSPGGSRAQGAAGLGQGGGARRAPPASLELRFGPKAFRRWDDRAGRWTVDRGEHDLVVAASAGDIRCTIRVTIT